MPDFREALKSGRRLLMDGAMGTELQRAGLPDGACHEAWNLDHPERVLAIHSAYVDAGAMCLVTNTFQSNPRALARHGRQDDLVEINRRAIELAREAAGSERFVLASVGPLDLAGGVCDLAATLDSLATADAWLLETWGEDATEALNCALAYGVPVLLSLTYLNDASKGPVTHPSLVTPAEMARRVASYDLAALGVNCGRDMGLEAMLHVVAAYREHMDVPLLARPNAGTPNLLGGQWIHPLLPTEMAALVAKLLGDQVRIVGGCCGTTPMHIRALSKIV